MFALLVLFITLLALSPLLLVAPEKFYRFALAKESAWKTPGAYTQARGLLTGSAALPTQEVLALDVALNSFGDRYAGILGAQGYTANINLLLHTAWFTDYADLFTAAMGTKDVTTSPTFSSSADNFTVTTTGNAASAWVKLTGNEGTPKTYYVPVEVDAAGVLTLGLGMATGVIATAIKNPGSCGGASFEWTLLGSSGTQAADTFSIESDWSNKPSSTTQRNVLASGCALTSFRWHWERDKPNWLETKWIGASYSDDGGAAANISDPGAPTAEGPGWTWDWWLTTNGTTKVTDATTPIKALTVELAPGLVIETGSQGLNGGSTASSTLPGSDITGFTRDAGFSQLLTLRLPWNAAQIAVHKAQTVHRLYGIGYPGVPGGAAISTTIRNCVSFRRLVPVGIVRDVVDGGGRYMDLDFQIERDLTSNTNQPPVAIARFVS